MQFTSESVPQITYDIIARILPGFVFFSLALLSTTTIETYNVVIDGKTISVKGLMLFGLVDLEISFFSTVLFIIVCYFLGWLFYRSKSEDREKTKEKIFHKLDHNSLEKINNHLSGQKSQLNNHNIGSSLLREMYHYVRLNDSAAGLRLVKLRAEVRMWESIKSMRKYLLFVYLFTSLTFGLMRSNAPSLNDENIIWTLIKLSILFFLIFCFRLFQKHTSIVSLWEKYWNNIVSHYKLLSNISTSNNQSKIIVFANCAGAAREEIPNPIGLGGYISGALNRQGQIEVVGISEVIKSEKNESDIGSPVIDDLTDLARGLGFKNRKTDYFPHLDSHQHNSENAQRKWTTNEASPRIRAEISKNRKVTQGTGVILFANHTSVERLVLKPAGSKACPDDTNPFGTAKDYEGNRDTEPRTAIILRGVELFENFEVDIAFCQLETKSTEERIFPYLRFSEENASNRRKMQLNRLCEKLIANNEGRPIIIMGDFNARPGSKELNALFDQFEFKQVLPGNIRREEDKTKGKWGQQYLYGDPYINPPIMSKSEAEQDWPYSHLHHKILIDHAFVRGFNPKEWTLTLSIIPFPDETKGTRYSDHRPIALFIEKR